MRSIISFLRPVLASFIVCMLLSWAGAEFKSATAINTAQGASRPAVAQKVIDATPPAMLANTVLVAALPVALERKAAEPAAEPTTADDAAPELFAAPNKTSLDDPAAVVPSERRQVRSREAKRSSTPAVPGQQASADSTADSINSPSLPGPTSVSKIKADTLRGGHSSEAKLASELLVAQADLPFPSSATPEVELTAADAPRGTAIGAIVSDDAKLASSADDSSALDAAIPEPSTLGMSSLGLAAWLIVRRRRSKSAR